MDETSKRVFQHVADETTKLLPQVYEDIAQPAAKEIGSALGRSTRALLSPVRGLLWGWEKIEVAIIEGIEKRLVNVPEENRKTPDPEIAVPLMQAFSYTAQNVILREMYLNLLSNSMDTLQEKDVHPSFVEIIKQMNSLDAVLLKRLYEAGGEEKSNILAMSPYYGNDNYNDNIIALDNLKRLGLITETAKDIEVIYTPPGRDGYFEMPGEVYVDNHGDDRYTTAITAFGIKFCKTCI